MRSCGRTCRRIGKPVEATRDLVFPKTQGRLAEQPRISRLAGGEYFGEVEGCDGEALAMHRAANLHQASAIVRNYGLRAALFDANDLVLDHRGRDVRKLDREHPAEPTAFFRVTKIDELESGDGAQKGARFVDDMQFAY